MAGAQLHTLKMMTGMMADESMAKFEMLAGRPGFNEAALEDMFIRGLPESILFKVYSQTSLPSGLDFRASIRRNYLFHFTLDKN